MRTFALAVVIAVYGVLYSWDLWEAIGNLVGLAPFYEALGIGDSVPWALLWAGVALPVVVFVFALVLSRGRERLGDRVIIFFVGWASIAAVSLTMASLEQVVRALALQALPG